MVYGKKLIFLRYCSTYFLRVPLLIYLLFSLTSSKAQQVNQTPEELEAALTEATGRERLLILQKLAWAYIYSEPSKSLQLSGQAYVSAISLGDTAQAAEARRRAGIVHFITSNYPLAFEAFRESYMLYLEIGDKPGEAACLNNFGNASYQVGNFTRAISFFEQSLAIREALGDSINVARVKNNLGETYLESGRIDTAIVLLEEAERVFVQLQSKEDIGRPLYNLSEAYRLLGNDTLAVKYMHASVKELEQGGNLIWLIKAYFTFAAYSLKQGEIETANSYTQKGLPIAEHVHNFDELIHGYKLMSGIRESEGNLAEAMAYQHKANTYQDSLRLSVIENGILEVELYRQARLATETTQKAQQQRLISRISIGVLILALPALALVGWLFFRASRTTAYFKAEQQKSNFLITSLPIGFWEIDEKGTVLRAEGTQASKLDMLRDEAVIGASVFGLKGLPEAIKEDCRHALRENKPSTSRHTTNTGRTYRIDILPIKMNGMKTRLMLVALDMNPEA